MMNRVSIHHSTSWCGTRTGVDETQATVLLRLLTIALRVIVTGAVALGRAC
jgi:hypothetical protein